MQIKYFQSAWNDIKNSPGWFGRLCLLALLNLIPIFGQIVTLGYLYGWMREIAWGVHKPMNPKILANEDGKLWRRGWFALVITFVFSLVPTVISSIGGGIAGCTSAVAFSSSSSTAVGLGSAGAVLGMLISLVGSVLGVVVVVLAWVGIGRMTIYDRLSAGFQLGKIWKMIRHDTNGILRIVGMFLIVAIIGVTVVMIIFTIAFTIYVFVLAASVMPGAINGSSGNWVFGVVFGGGLVGFILFAALMYACFALNVFLYMLLARALGYWFYQFDVANWHGQDDPMPFEVIAQV